MPDPTDDFGKWKTAPDGTAHYVIGDTCLCRAKIKKWGGPPKRKTWSTPGGVGKFETELCAKCLTQNYLRWARKGGKPTHVLSARLDRRHRRAIRPWMRRAKKP